MPIYEYKCNTCEKVFEVITTSHLTKKPVCKKCGSEDVQKLLSATSFNKSANSSAAAGCAPRGGFS